MPELTDKSELATEHSKLTSRKLAILVLRGGPSAERQVSLESGRCVADALRQMGHEVLEADIGPDNLSALDGDGSKPFDIVFPILHGTFGEDGRLQKILEQRAIRFVGSGSHSSQLAMDKYTAKKLFEQAGLLTPKAILIENSANSSNNEQQLNNQITESIDQMNLPCVIKPNQQGSSIGVVIAQRQSKAQKAAIDSMKNYGDCLIERYIPGREFTVGIVADRVLPVLEVRPTQEFYDYSAKYDADDTEYIFDHSLPAKQAEQMRQIAFKAFTALGCRDLARVDMIMDENGQIFVLEVNTLPGFTDHSLVPKAADHIGISMENLCDQIAQTAYDRPI